MFDPSSFANPTPLAHTDTSRDVFPRGGTSQRTSISKGRNITTYQYEIGDIFAIQRAQFGTGVKLRPKFFGPYEVVIVKPKNRYDVRKIGLHEGPNTTSTAADHMKMWGETV
ncbi:transposon Tf2-9 polyprotein [Trichonephila clavipes]|nr:transposon Tf2-9 polyprotein [Trichonephila clavipes]